jgi:hypothetical protein
MPLRDPSLVRCRGRLEWCCPRAHVLGCTVGMQDGAAFVGQDGAAERIELLGHPRRTRDGADIKYHTDPESALQLRQQRLAKLDLMRADDASLLVPASAQ